MTDHTREFESTFGRRGGLLSFVVIAAILVAARHHKKLTPLMMNPLQVRLRILRSLIGLMLIANTWPVWFRSGEASAFPLIPFFSFLTSVPSVVDSVLSVLLILVLVYDLISALRCIRSTRNDESATARCVSCLGFCGAGIALAALDQQRLQPWLYHLLLLTPILMLPDCGTVARRHRWMSGWSTPGLLLLLTGSIYAWSAWSKLDTSFIHGHGANFVEAILGAVGLSTRFWTPGMRTAAAALLPAGEFIVALALVFPQTRRLGLLGSLGMHGALLLAVGPWGMNERPGVVLWNIYFIIQNALLARHLKAAAAAPGDNIDDKPAARLRVAVTVLTMCASVAPAFRMLDCFDNWPSWAVYAGSTRRVLVLVKPNVLEAAPGEIRDHIEERLLGDGFAWLRLDQWSLAELNAPIYPQDRFQVGIALAVTEKHELGDSIRLVIEGRADRFTGKRALSVLEGQSAIAEHAAGYRFNTQARVQ